MASDLLSAGPSMQLGVHNGNEQPPQRLNRRALLRGGVAAAVVGAIPSVASAFDPAPDPNRPYYEAENKFRNGVNSWGVRQPPSTASRLMTKGKSFLTAAFNSPLARAGAGTKPFLRVFGRAIPALGIASVVLEVAQLGMSLIAQNRNGNEQWNNVKSAVNNQLPAEYNPNSLSDFHNVPSDYYPPGEYPPNAPPRYNEPLTFDYISPPVIEWAQITAGIRLPATSIFVVKTRNTNYTAIRPEPELTMLQRAGLSESLVAYKSWNFVGGSVPPGLAVDVIQYRVVGEVPAAGIGWEQMSSYFDMLPKFMNIEGTSLAQTLNEAFTNSGDPELMQAIAQTPFVGSDFPNMTLGDMMQEVPEVVVIDKELQAVDPSPNPGTGSGTIEWGIFERPQFELPELQIPEIPTAQELIDMLTNPLGMLIPQQSNSGVACPPFPWLMGQSVTAHCDAVSLAQPFIGNVSRLAAQIAAFFIALRD